MSDSIMLCPYCAIDTAGNHAWNCPTLLHKENKIPLPSDGEYPYTSRPDWRVAILQSQVDEARRVACEQYTRALKAERERDNASDSYCRMYRTWAKAEREKQELVKALKYYKSAGRIDIVEPADDCLCDYCMATRRIQAALAKVE